MKKGNRLNRSILFTAAMLSIVIFASDCKKPRLSVTGLAPDLPGDFPQEPTQADANAFAWQLFVALNWPALTDAADRGKPDTSKVIGEGGPVVWETWKSVDEVFYSDGRKPAPWDVYGQIPYPPECNIPANEKKAFVLHQTAKSPDALADRVNQAVGYSLTDQSGNLVHYYISFSKDTFDVIYNNGYYNIQGQEQMRAAIQFVHGAMEMKASWRILPSDTPQEFKNRFYRTGAYVYSPASSSNPASCVYSEVGLLGLHFIRKVNVKGSDQWVWATFEQVDNVPPFGTPFSPGTIPSDRKFPYNLFNPKCTGQYCTYNMSTEDGRPESVPTQVIRQVNIGQNAQAVNPEWQQKLQSAVANSPWQYYQLIDTQWTQNPEQPPFGNPTPGTVSNATMETYVQRESSCVGCHSTAENKVYTYAADYSFMLAQACPDGAVNSVCTPSKTTKK